MMKRIAAFVLSLAIFTVPTVALADFHGPNDGTNLDRAEEAVQAEATFADKKALQVEEGFALWIRRPETIG